MPAKSYKKKKILSYAKKIGNKGKWKKKNKISLGYNKLSSFPISRICKMRFNINYVMDGTAVLMDQNFILANGLYKPDISDGTNRNAMGYHNWGQFYERYTVLSSHIKATYVATVNAIDNGQFNPYVVGVQVVDSDSDHENVLSNIVENNSARVRYMQGQTNGNVCTINAYYNAKKWHGIKDVQDVEELDSDFVITQEQADTKGVQLFPQDPTYFRLFYHAGETGIDPKQVQVNCVVTYTVMCKDPRNLISVPSIIPTPPP